MRRVSGIGPTLPSPPSAPDGSYRGMSCRPVRSEQRDRGPTHCLNDIPLPCRELASGLKSSMKICGTLIDPGTEFDAVRTTNTYGAPNTVSAVARVLLVRFAESASRRRSTASTWPLRLPDLAQCRLML